MALMLAVFVSALGLGLVTLSATERALVGNFSASLQRSYDCDAFAERVVLELRTQGAWTEVLAGNVRSALHDHTTTPAVPWGGTLDVPALTLQLQRDTDSASAWGLNTPSWQLFAWGSLDDLFGSAEGRTGYAAAWVSDDGSETDNNPSVDENGRMLVHVEVHGPRAATRAIDVVLGQIEPGTPPGRILSWKSMAER